MPLGSASRFRNKAHHPSKPERSHDSRSLAPHWEKTDVEYVVKEGFPNRIIVLRSGDLALNDMPFRDGTIEFDVKPLAVDMPGIRLRDRDSQNAEELYIRTFQTAGPRTIVF